MQLVLVQIAWPLSNQIIGGSMLWDLQLANQIVGGSMLWDLQLANQIVGRSMLWDLQLVNQVMEAADLQQQALSGFK